MNTFKYKYPCEVSWGLVMSNGKMENGVDRRTGVAPAVKVKKELSLKVTELLPIVMISVEIVDIAGQNEFPLLGICAHWVVEQPLFCVGRSQFCCSGHLIRMRYT